MKKVFAVILLSVVAAWASYAQDTQEAVAEAAAALEAADDVPVPVEKPKYWTTSLLTNINVGQTWLSNWAAGGYNSITLAANVDAQSNFAKDKMIWNNRLQMDYGFLYSQDKPIVQKNKDRFYFESKWGYETPIKNLSYSANFDFKTQFDDNFAYGTPKVAEGEPTVQDWLNARTLKSGFLAPAYLNLGLGVLWKPAAWFSLNVAPVTGGLVVVTNPLLRKTYGMDPIAWDETDPENPVPTDWQACRFELGAQIKADAAWVINDAFSYTTQLVVFYNYLKPTVEPRINWDNKIFWKLAKFFALTLSTNLIYDPLVLVRDLDNDGTPETKGVQFKEFLEFGFTYTITHKH